MRIALLHNASWIGSSVAHALLDDPRNEVALLAPEAREVDEELRAVAARRGTRYETIASARDPRLARRLEAFRPDILLVATFPWRVPRAAREAARLAALNLHPSLLPRDRGPLPEFWVIRDGAARTGLTVHLMEDRFDAGPILAQTPVRIEAGDTMLTLTERMTRAAPPLVREVLEAYRSGARPAASPQDEARATSHRMPTGEDLSIDWRQPAVSVGRLVRAAFPALEVTTTRAGERVVIRRACVAPEARALSPGEIELAADHVRIGTGEGALEVTAIGDGEALAFARARGWRDGDVLGCVGAQVLALLELVLGLATSGPRALDPDPVDHARSRPAAL